MTGMSASARIRLCSEHAQGKHCSALEHCSRDRRHLHKQLIGSMEQAVQRRVGPRRTHKEISMRSTILIAAALVLFSSAVMAQSTDTTSPPTTGPAAQSDSMSKGDMSKDKMSKKKMTKSEKMKKTHEKM
jgi:pentapeptide MXKDX repeat protein